MPRLLGFAHDPIAQEAEPWEVDGDGLDGIERLLEMHGAAGGDDIRAVLGQGVVAHVGGIGIGAALGELLLALLLPGGFGLEPGLGGVAVKLLLGGGELGFEVLDGLTVFLGISNGWGRDGDVDDGLTQGGGLLGYGGEAG